MTACPDDVDHLIEQGGPERKCQVAMGDRALERSRPRSMAVDVNPLAITGRLGEAVDLILCDPMPAARAQVVADEARQVTDVDDRAGQTVLVDRLSCRGSRLPDVARRFAVAV